MSDRPAFLKGRGRGRGNDFGGPKTGVTPGRNQNVQAPGRGRGDWSGENGAAPGRNQNVQASGRGRGDWGGENGAAPGRNQNVQASGRSRGDWGGGKDRQQTVDKIENPNSNQGNQSAEQRFQEASSQYQESIKRHLREGQAGDEEGDNSSEDEEDIGNNVLEKIFHNYSSTNDTDTGNAQDSMLHSFRSGTSACLVCIDTIKKNDPIWSCEGCHAIFHIQCIQKWIREGVYQQMYKSEDDNIRQQDIPWHCPKCRLEYSQAACPTRYLCFCGKVEDPKFDPWLVPHSCGQTCARPLVPDCGHTCLLLCHPGGCPPCPKTVRVDCYCGNSAPQVRRCSARAWACGGTCGRRLACGQHTCQQACHPGECAACPKTSSQPCQCGRSKAVRPCASPQWQCDRMCGRSLSCGNHICEQVCHAGPCGACPRGGERKCPCGKTAYDLPCTEDIPTCGDTCGKMLDCGRHKCVQRCHTGPCGACMQMAVKRCRCESQKEREVPCYKEYLCESKCTKMRDCGKHQCKRKCCDGNCPSCEQLCNKTLGCRNHKCASRCHRGPCYPCPETVDIKCFCKQTKITVPCGREKITKPPRCNYPCRIPPDCHHPERLPHRCHFKECPLCRQTCAKPLPNCDHTCPVMCHAAVRVRTKDNTKRVGPWEGGPRIIESIVNKPCPPCMVPLQQQCYGKHETGTFACSVIQPYGCGRVCGRELKCGNHTCALPCHVVEGAEDTQKAGTNCQQCELPCQFDRPEGCSHPCTRACHPDLCPPCTQMVRMRCHCQTTVKYIECHKWVGASQQSQDEMRSCGGPCPKMLSCDHQCSLTCHPGKCSRPDQCERKVNIRCKCRRQKRDIKCREREVEMAKLTCDDKCRQLLEEKKQKEKEAERKKKEEEERKQKAELEEFERRQKGRKRKPRRQQQEVKPEGFLQTYKTWLILGVSVLILAVFAAYIFNVS